MAVDAFDLIGQAEAQAEYAVARAIGKRLQYSNRSSTSVVIRGFPGKFDSAMSVILETRSEEIRRTFLIAAQPSFPPASGITIDDVITFEGDQYRVQTWTDISTHSGKPSEADVDRGVYRLETVCTRTKQVGKVS